MQLLEIVLFKYRFWVFVVQFNGCDDKIGIKQLASLQIHCAALWQQSGNVRV